MCDGNRIAKGPGAGQGLGIGYMVLHRVVSGQGREGGNCVLAIGGLGGVGWRCREFFPCFA